MNDAWWSVLEDPRLEITEDGDVVEEDGSVPDAHTALVPYVEGLMSDASWRVDASDVHHSVYSGLQMSRAALGGALRYVGARGLDEQRLNFVKNCADAIHVKIAKQRPGVKALASDAKLSDRAKARLIGRMLSGEFSSEKVYEKTNTMSIEAIVDGTAVLRVYPDWEARRVCCETVPSSELFVDEAEAKYGTPRCIYRAMRIDRGQLLKMYPSAAAEIEAAPQSRALPGEPPSAAKRDMVDVFAAHRLPPGPWEDGDDSLGREAVCVRGATLSVREWAHPRFPYVFYRWEEPAPGRGFWGRGAVEDMLPAQWEIDRTVNQIQFSLRAASMTKVFVHAELGPVHDTDLQDTGLTVIKHNGQRPEIVAPNPVSQQLFQYLQFLIDKLYQTSGMSQDAAQSNKPAGINSGVALQYYHDFQTQRFIDQARRWAHVHVEIAELWVMFARELASHGGGYEARWDGADALHDAAWRDVDLDADRFTLRLETISEQAESYAGRQNLLAQLTENGHVPPGYVVSLIENPDLPRAERMLGAKEAYAEHVVELLSAEDLEELPTPDPMCDVELTMGAVRTAYLDALVRPGVPEDVLQNFRDFAVQLEMLAQRAAPPPQGQAPAPQGPPPGQQI